jgi:hypothetical protein
MSRSAALFAVLASVACGGGPHAPDPRYPTRPEGCDVEVFADEAPMPVDTIGHTPVRVSCSFGRSNQECLRMLEDEACKLGGDVLTGVPPQPVPMGDVRKLWGRVAHTHTQ